MGLKISAKKMYINLKKVFIQIRIKNTYTTIFKPTVFYKKNKKNNGNKY